MKVMWGTDMQDAILSMACVWMNLEQDTSYYKWPQVCGRNFELHGLFTTAHAYKVPLADTAAG